MNKLKKFLKTLLIFTLVFFLGLGTTFADTAPNTLKINHKNASSTPIKFPTNFRIKTTSDGKYVYCMTYSKKPPVSSVSYTKGTAYTDAGTAYILEQGANVTNDNDFFAYQTALWIYLMDNGMMEQAYTITAFKTNLKYSSSSYKTKINEIVNHANSLRKSGAQVDTSTPTINLSDSISFALSNDKQYYVSNALTVTSSTGKYTLNLDSAPKGTTYSDNGGKITIKVPVSSLTTEAQTVKLTASNSKTVATSYKYNPSDSKYQVMGATYFDTKTASDSVSTTLKIEKGKVSISKQDVTNKEELPGATLEVKDANGKIIDKWVSTTKPHEMQLAPGTYTLTETIAPEGYELSTETITFEVKKDGSTTSVVMYNAKKIISKVSVTKQDVETKTNVAGAKLEIVDEEGNIVASWTSTEEAKVITGLPAGTYTLRETTAPEGYDLSEEEVTFIVKEDSEKVVDVVMYNSKTPKEEIEVESTSSFKTMTSSIIGILVLLIGSILITKNFKKKYE